MKEKILAFYLCVGYRSFVGAKLRPNSQAGLVPQRRRPPRMQNIPTTAILDAGKVRLGAGCRQLIAQAVPAPIPNLPPAAIADAGKVRLGAGCRR